MQTSYHRAALTKWAEKRLFEQNLNNNREKDTKIKVSKSCQLVELQKVLIENNWLDFCIN